MLGTLSPFENNGAKTAVLFAHSTEYRRSWDTSLALCSSYLITRELFPKAVQFPDATGRRSVTHDFHKITKIPGVTGFLSAPRADRVPAATTLKYSITGKGTSSSTCG
ncbi:hypothetical protein HPB47_014831 [Ixodes persulcatus]|uniref:Uncharacterized protein n=1 Tax=Ixodes persulcatus TaxID=34615 RepID=A0AC60QV04_IXOPE|nr:hypothetical protein HPB47_014831 [Ixodes persulcatus]